MITNEEELDKFLEQFEEIQRLAAPIAAALFKKDGYTGVDVEPEDICVESGGYLMARTSIRDRWGDWNQEEKYISSSYLFEKDYAAKIDEEIRLKQIEAKRLEEEKKEQEKAEKKVKAEKAKYEKYLELKSYYEGDYDNE